MHDKTSSRENASFKMYPSQKKSDLSPEKKLPPPPGHHIQTHIVKNSQSLLKKSQPPTPYNIFQPSLKMS